MELFYFIPFIILFLIAISMVVHGWLIVNQHFGYSEHPNIKKHPEMEGVKKGEKLLMIKFTDEDLQELQQKILEQKMKELFEEPSTYEDDDDI